MRSRVAVAVGAKAAGAVAGGVKRPALKRPAASVTARKMEHVPEEHILEEYGDFADDYETTLQGYGYVSHREAPKMVIGELMGRPPREDGALWRILDLGCGTGNTALLYFESGSRFSVVGVDLTPQMLEKARERPYERLVCQNVEDELEVEDDSFDAVQFIGVTEFFNQPAQTFTRVRKKLREDGLMVMTSAIKIPRQLELKYKIKTWELGELEGHAKQSGFQHLRSERFLAYDLGDVAVQYNCSLWRRVPDAAPQSS